MKNQFCILVLAVAFMLGMAPAANAQPNTIKKQLLWSDDFTSPLDTLHWQVETIPSPYNLVYTKKRKLWLDVRDGVTVWFKQPLSGNYCIEYLRGFPADTTLPNYRQSDLNNFWQATDIRSKNLFARNGVLAAYDSLRLYYAGIGGNYNSTTRFRRYDGNGARELLQEYTDVEHLLQAGMQYQIQIIVKNGNTQLWVNNTLWFSYNDPAPLPAGYFGLRSTKSLQWISDMKIWKIE